ncbi:hypothetical protein ACOMHN_057721 [Nucella lapillus]
MRTVVLTILAAACLALTVAMSLEEEPALEVADEVPPTQCPPGMPVPMCLGDPCDDADCPAVSSAKCSPYLCGGCYRKWADADGNDVTDKCEP